MCTESLQAKRREGSTKVSLQYLSKADRLKLRVKLILVALDLGLLSEILLQEYPVSELSAAGIEVS